mmetsp:Transcript_12935/g.14571  ORF Transcript_12935/g.14571 Transcript_12935/m.14571 type:complete len:247 (+) Transcript_12935:28-768(+)|eukprot:CAMPEP_0205833648 /NCGR_PEP_ID=MMETSP0206-20130828/50151_1 /ASSEMBLY_ACC=CAM_ASM_000279 /TAXON_ID=36767 /ORGANISM="Euplotes focardii, Strain TN1" /LENGTH=246 /DNA_ID=CAMNT_0053140225 /DNA_START=611 /DNA_END=1351 /DNA_ORIENTATION=+
MIQQCKELTSKDDSFAKFSYNSISDDFVSDTISQRIEEIHMKPLKPLNLKNLTADSDNDSASIFSTLEQFELPPPALTPEYEHSERRMSTDLSSDSPSVSSDGMSESLMSNSDQLSSGCTDSTTSMEKYSENNQKADKNDTYSFKLPPAALFNGQEEFMRPLLFRKGSSCDYKKDVNQISTKFSSLSKYSPKETKTQGERRGEKPIHPESILNFLKKNCAAGQAKLLAINEPDSFDWSVPIKCSDF